MTTQQLLRYIFQESSGLQHNIVHYLPTLRLVFDGGVANDYRLRGHCVEFRTNEGPWRILDDSDLAIHYRFDTEVARWLRRRSIEANPHGRNVS